MISGMGELHLEIYGERIKREYGIPVTLGNPTVNYRETVSQRAEFNYLHKKQTGGAGQFARVVGYIEPTFSDIMDPTNSQACEFKDALIGTNIPNEYKPAIEKAFHEVVKKGPLTGFPVVSVRYVIEDGQTHSVDSSSMAFMTATKQSFKEAFKKAEPKILEPIMNVEITVPMKFQPAIMGQILK